MTLRIWQFTTILLASLLMGTAFGHLLEMPMKMKVSGELWLTFQHSLYAWFAMVGGPIEMLTIASTAALAYRVRRSSQAFWPALIAAVVFACAFFGIWLGLINPVNAKTASWTADAIPPDWQHWRRQWEYSHAARFCLQFIALALLLKSVFPLTIEE